MTRSLLVLVALAGSGSAIAEPNLVLQREPMPRTLRMRRTVAQVPTPPARPRTPMPTAPNVSATSSEPIEGLDGLRDVRQPVSFSVNLGYQVDGARPSGRAGIGSSAPKPGVDYSKLRSYGFGEAFFSSRGLGLTSLETYFALRFQAANAITATGVDINGEEQRDRPLASPLATWFERSGYEFRTGWAEVKDFLPKRFGLQKLRVRAGSQFVYGPWILHMDGLYATYEGPTLTAALYSGPRHSDYTRDQTERRPLANGGSVRFDLRGLTDKVPIAIGVEAMSLTASDETGEGTVDAELLQIDWRPRRDFVVIGQIRGVNGDIGSQRVEVRTRYKQVTNFVFDVMRRTIDDWRWDPSLVTRPTQDLTEARRYLDLGPVVPQVIASARAGTLIRENIDLLARVAVATDLEEGDEIVDAYSAPYLELAGAVEIRLRRQVALGLSLLSRQTARESDDLEDSERIPDLHGPIDALPESAQLGEDSFQELGATLKMSLGARRFSAMVEVYGRNTNYAHIYTDPLAPLPINDIRGGGRFTVDAWVGRRIRLFASYDVSSALDTAPEINGYKSLRMMVSGIY